MRGVLTTMMMMMMLIVGLLLKDALLGWVVDQSVELLLRRSWLQFSSILYDNIACWQCCIIHLPSSALLQLLLAASHTKRLLHPLRVDDTLRLLPLRIVVRRVNGLRCACTVSWWDVETCGVLLPLRSQDQVVQWMLRRRRSYSKRRSAIKRHLAITVSSCDTTV